MKSSLPPFWDRFKKRHAEIEARVEDKSGSYKNLSHEALYTSFEDLNAILEHPLVKGTFLDLGCGSGQTVLYYAHKYPDRKSIGIEFQEERLSLGRELNIPNALLIHGDLLHCPIPDADTYFLYFPTGPVLDRMLSELYQKKNEFVLVAIESHGHLFPRLDLENWLTLSAEISLHSKRHDDHARIYRRNFKERSLEPFLHTYQDHYLLIENGDETWIGDTFGMEWQEGERFELLTPPRTILWKDVKKLMLLEEIPSEFHKALHIRKQGLLTITTNRGTYQGFIRKIIIEPSFVVELSSGEKVEWSQIQTIYQGPTLCYESSSLS